MEKEFSWEGPEFAHRPKTSSWYWGSIILGVTMIGIATWQGNLLFGLFILIAEILLLTGGGTTPRMVTFHMNHDGLSIGESTHYPLAKIAAFSIQEHGPEDPRAVVLYFRNNLQPRLRLFIPAEEFPGVIDILGHYVAQAEYHTSFTETLEEFFGF